MWLNETLARRAGEAREAAAADLGVTTIGGENAAVLARGEIRSLPVYAPGGVVWQPRAGDAVLLLKGGPGGREQCVAAADTAGHVPDGFAPGELYLYAAGGKASIYLKNDGAIAVTGNVTVEGRVDVSGELYVGGVKCGPCTCG